MGCHTWTHKLSNLQPTDDEIRAQYLEYHLANTDEVIRSKIGVDMDEEDAERYIRDRKHIIRELQSKRKLHIDFKYGYEHPSGISLTYSRITGKWYESVGWPFMFRVSSYPTYQILNPKESFDKFVKLYGHEMYGEGCPQSPWWNYQKYKELPPLSKEIVRRKYLKDLKQHQKDMLPTWRRQIQEFFSKYPGGMIYCG